VLKVPPMPPKIELLTIPPPDGRVRAIASTMRSIC